MLLKTVDWGANQLHRPSSLELFCGQKDVGFCLFVFCWGFFSESEEIIKTRLVGGGENGMETSFSVVLLQ